MNSNSFEANLARVREILQAHFTTDSDQAVQTADASLKKLEALGLNAQTAPLITETDIGNALPNVPALLVRQIAQILRSTKVEGKEDKTGGFIPDAKVRAMTFEALLARYNPDEDNSIARRLKEIVGNAAVIVFADDGTIDSEASAKLVKEVKDGFGGRPSHIIVIKGVPRRIFKLGEKPDSYVDENPIYKGRPLRPDGTCDQLQRSWEDVATSVRQFIRVIVDTSDVAISRDQAHRLLDLALSENAEAQLTKYYPAEYVRYTEAKANDMLPKLRVPKKHRTNGNPFNI